MAGGGIPVVAHPWLGGLRRHTEDELLGFVEVDPAVRMPASNGSRVVEILLNVPAGLYGPALNDHVQRCADYFGRPSRSWGLSSITRSVTRRRAGWRSMRRIPAR